MVSCLCSLVQLCCWEGRVLQTNITGVCGDCSQCLGHTGFAPAHGMCFSSLHCLGFRLLCKEWALGCVQFPGLSLSGSGSRVLHKGADSVRPAFCAVPQSKQFRRPGAWRAHSPQVRWVLSPPCPSLLVSRRAHLQCAVCLFSGADLWLRPSWQMSTVQNLRKALVRNWKPVRSLVGDTLSGAEFAPFRLWLALPTPCLRWGMGQSAAG